MPDCGQLPHISYLEHCSPCFRHLNQTKTWHSLWKRQFCPTSTFVCTLNLESWPSWCPCSGLDKWAGLTHFKPNMLQCLSQAKESAQAERANTRCSVCWHPKVPAEDSQGTTASLGHCWLEWLITMSKQGSFPWKSAMFWRAASSSVRCLTGNLEKSPPLLQLLFSFFFLLFSLFFFSCYLQGMEETLSCYNLRCPITSARYLLPTALKWAAVLSTPPALKQAPAAGLIQHVNAKSDSRKGRKSSARNSLKTCR